MAIKPSIVLNYSLTDADLQFFRQMALRHCELVVDEEHMNEDFIGAQIERFRSFEIEPLFVNVPTMQKNDIIDLNLTEKNGQKVSRDDEIAKFIRLLDICGKLGIPFTSIAWQPVGVKSTAHQPGACSHGANTRIVDINEVLARPNDYDRVYTEDEVWENFEYFLKAVTPACERNHVSMALHPNDPPVASTNGVASLIWNSDCYRRAFALDKAGVLAMKFCIGCWLEGPHFGDVEADLEEFIKAGRVTMIHFRNIDRPMDPRFEETLMEDGYADMFRLLEIIMHAGYDNMIYVDHVFGDNHRVEDFAYPFGYLKGMITAVEHHMK